MGKSYCGEIAWLSIVTVYTPCVKRLLLTLNVIQTAEFSAHLN